MPSLYDLRDRAIDPHPKGRTRSGRTVRRDPATVDTVVLHQAGVEYGARLGRPLHERALATACHAMAFRDGSAVLACPATWYIQHANSYNSRSVGLEIDGLYPGLRGGKVPGGKRASAEDQLVVEAGRLALEQLVETARADRCPIRRIRAHRQADSWRRADPGEWLWRSIVLDYAVPVLGLELDIAERLDNRKGPDRRGLPIPTGWGGSGPY